MIPANCMLGSAAACRPFSLAHTALMHSILNWAKLWGRSSWNDGGEAGITLPCLLRRRLRFGVRLEVNPCEVGKLERVRSAVGYNSAQDHVGKLQ